MGKNEVGKNEVMHGILSLDLCLSNFFQCHIHCHGQCSPNEIAWHNSMMPKAQVVIKAESTNWQDQEIQSHLPIKFSAKVTTPGCD
jgi:hypothetical protein